MFDFVWSILCRPAKSVSWSADTGESSRNRIPHRAEYSQALALTAIPPKKVGRQECGTATVQRKIVAKLSLS